MLDSPAVMTLQQHVLLEQRRLAPDATGEFSWLLSGITLATKMIQAKIRQAGLQACRGCPQRFWRRGCGKRGGRAEWAAAVIQGRSRP